MINKQKEFDIENMSEDYIYKITETWHTQFVKKQEDFIKQECIEHIKEKNRLIRLFKIDEDKLDYIFNLGLHEYLRERNSK